jgi:hypothetical protein
MTRTTSHSLPTHPTATGTAPLRRGFSGSSSLLLENPAAPRRVIGTLSAPAPLPGGVPRRWPRAAMLAWAVIVATQLTACSKTVVWEEEVPLNTGEVIWVKRTVEYALRGAGSNPFDISMSPKWDELIEFTWNGKKYAYQGEATIMLLAISPDKKPVLVAPSGDKGWDSKNRYPCNVPAYVELVPDATGKKWTWPAKIEPWLYKMPYNLMQTRKKAEEMTKIYSTQERLSEDSGFSHVISMVTIDPTYDPEPKNCLREENK